MFCFAVSLSVNLSLFLYCLLSWNDGWLYRHGGLWGPPRKWHQSCRGDSQHGLGPRQRLPQLQDSPQAQHAAEDPGRHPLRYWDLLYTVSSEVNFIWFSKDTFTNVQGSKVAVSVNAAWIVIFLCFKFTMSDRLGKKWKRGMFTASRGSLHLTPHIQYRFTRTGLKQQKVLWGLEPSLLVWNRCADQILTTYMMPVVDLFYLDRVRLSPGNLSV